jgi:hypothetical protein
MDRQLSEIEKAFHDTRQELISAAQRTYEQLRRELDKLTARANKTAERVNELAGRLQEQAQKAVNEGSKAAATQAKRIERALTDARKELEAVSKDQKWLKTEAARAYDYFRRVSGIDKAVAAVEKEWNKRTGRTAKKEGRQEAEGRRQEGARAEETGCQEEGGREEEAGSEEEGRRQEEASDEKESRFEKEGRFQEEAGRQEGREQEENCGCLSRTLDCNGAATARSPPRIDISPQATGCPAAASASRSGPRCFS